MSPTDPKAHQHAARQARQAPRVRTKLALAAVLIAVASAAALLLSQFSEPAAAASAAPQADTGTLARGAYLARLGNCAGCHTARGGQPYAGGRGIQTPFGTVFAGNLTPDDATGLGRWTAEDFWRALHHGRSREGRLLSPAFPYTAFTHVTRADSDALYVHLRSLAPVAQAQTPSSLRFPFNTQLAMAAWRSLYFRPSAQQAPSDDQHTAEWQRGAYLVRGLGHCAACHAPRNALGATSDPQALAGGVMPLQPWTAPALGPRADQPLEQQQRSIIGLLRTGMSDQGTAGGPMAEVVVSSTQHWSEPDLRAVAVYLSSLPARDVPKVQLDAAQPVLATQLARGRALYGQHCVSCHGEQGQGAPGAYPALAGNSTVLLGDAGNLLQALRHGGFTPATQAQPRPFGMPPSALGPEALADIATYVRQAWGNAASPVTTMEALRAP